MRLQYAGIVIAIASIAGIGLADTITMKNGRVINGTYLGGTARQVKVEVNDEIQTLNVSDVARIDFSGALSAFLIGDLPGIADARQYKPVFNLRCVELIQTQPGNGTESSRRKQKPIRASQ